MPALLEDPRLAGGIAQLVGLERVAALRTDGRDGVNFWVPQAVACVSKYRSLLSMAWSSRAICSDDESGTVPPPSPWISTKCRGAAMRLNIVREAAGSAAICDGETLA